MRFRTRRRWSGSRRRRLEEKRKKERARACEDAATDEYFEEKKVRESVEEFVMLALATNQLITPFDDSPMGAADLHRLPRRTPSCDARPANTAEEGASCTREHVDIEKAQRDA